MALSWALSYPKWVCKLGRRSPQLMMGMLWEGRMWRSRGNWKGLHTLVLLQTDWDSLQQEGGAGQGCAVAGSSSVPGIAPSVGADLGRCFVSLLLAPRGWRSLMGWPRAEPVPSWCLWGCTAPLSHQTLSLGTQPGGHPSAKALGASIPTQPLGRDTCFP